MLYGVSNINTDNNRIVHQFHKSYSYVLSTKLLRNQPEIKENLIICLIPYKTLVSSEVIGLKEGL